MSNRDGQPCNGGRGVVTSHGSVHTVKGPVLECSSHALHATHNPDAWKGDRLWVVQMGEDVVDCGDKLASTSRKCLCEITELDKYIAEMEASS